MSIRTRENAFSADDQELLEALAVQAARVIHNTWLYEQLRLKARLVRVARQCEPHINSTLNLDDALQVITAESVHFDAGQNVFAHDAG